MKTYTYSVLVFDKIFFEEALYNGTIDAENITEASEKLFNKFLDSDHIEITSITIV